MTAHARRVAWAGMIALTFAVGCESSERQAAEAARDASEVAASPEQKQLWEGAADKGDAPGLQRVPILQDPVAQRARTQVPASQAKPAPPQDITITPGVRNEIRILVYPNDPFQNYTGPADVQSVEQNGDRIQLVLPGKLGTLTLLVRVGTQQLPVKIGETVNVAYQARRNPQLPNDVIAIRTAAGAGIAHVIQGGYGPIQAMAIPLFGLTAEQRNLPGLPVQMSGPGLKPVDLSMGQTMDSAGGVTVRIVGSIGPQKGIDIGLIEGAPFTLNVMVWRVP